MLQRIVGRRDVTAGLIVVLLAFLAYWLCASRFDAGRPDIFYLAKAFTEGRTWLDVRPGPWDVIAVGGRFYVPFAPFHSVAFMPFAAVFGPVTLDRWEAAIDAALAAIDIGLCWLLLGRLGVSR